MTETLFSGYVWDCYEYITTVDANGYAFPLPRKNNYLKIEESSINSDRVGYPKDKYYLWHYSDEGIQKGVVTTKRNPLEITLSDIIGEYIIDVDGLENLEGYIGLGNMVDINETNNHWVDVMHDRNANGYDVLAIEWGNDLGESGYDICHFDSEIDADALTTVSEPSPQLDIMDSLNPDDTILIDSRLYNFENSGYIEITLINNGNYLTDGRQIYSGANSLPSISYIPKIELYNDSNNKISTKSIVIPKIATSQTGENSISVIFDIPSAGKYYVKIYDGGTRFYNMVASGGSVKSCDLRCYWSLHVVGVQKSVDNRCVTLKDYLNYWYERSNFDERFHPRNIYNNMNANPNYFGNMWGCWNGLDMDTRVLWNDGNNSIYLMDIDDTYPISTLNEPIMIYNKNELGSGQLIRAKDIPNFELYKIGIDGTVKYPDVEGTGQTTLTFENDEWCSPPDGAHIGFSFDDTFTSEVEKSITNINNTIFYNDVDRYSGVPNMIYLDFNVKGNNVIDQLSLSPTIDVTFDNDHTYTFDVTSRSGSVPSNCSYTVDLNNQWRLGSMYNPDYTLYEGVYESYSNYNVNNQTATMRITITGYDTFTLYIRSYGENSFDYVMVSQLDVDITGSTSYSDTTKVKAHTKGSATSGVILSSYKAVQFENIQGGTHVITIVYRKDSSKHENDDRGYVLISKQNTKYVGVKESYISASCSNPEEFSLAEIGGVKYIDYSGLVFLNAGDIDPDPEPTIEYEYLDITNCRIPKASGEWNIYGNGNVTYSTNFETSAIFHSKELSFNGNPIDVPCCIDTNESGKLRIRFNKTDLASELDVNTEYHLEVMCGVRLDGTNNTAPEMLATYLLHVYYNSYYELILSDSECYLVINKTGVNSVPNVTYTNNAYSQATISMSIPTDYYGTSYQLGSSGNFGYGNMYLLSNMQINYTGSGFTTRTVQMNVNSTYHTLGSLSNGTQGIYMLPSNLTFIKILEYLKGSYVRYIFS